MDDTLPRRRLVDLSHTIREGMVTYPGLPAPHVEPHLTRERSREIYAAGTALAMEILRMIGNIGTILDSPFHRYADGSDAADLPLSTLVDLPAVVVRWAVPPKVAGMGTLPVRAYASVS